MTPEIIPINFDARTEHLICTSLRLSFTMLPNISLTRYEFQFPAGNRKGKKNRRGDRRELETEEADEQTKNVRQQRDRHEDSIYGDIGDYVPSRKGDGTRDGRRRPHGPYFDKRDEDEEKPAGGPVLKVNKSAQILNRLTQEPEGYAECYPGLEEMNDAIDDSDDEVDYSKMDLGNKKGPIGRWDFDTAEEYSDYMNQKEALPKAAFQYGVKMADGRRSRKHKDKNEKAHLDREWQKIQNIIHKHEPESKRAKY